MTTASLNWVSVNMSKARTATVPAFGGIYLIAEVIELYGLQVELRKKYIGRANNLRRRFLEHLSLTKAHNYNLFKDIRSKGT